MNGGIAAVKIRTSERYHHVSMIAVDDIHAAARRIAEHLPATPLLPSPWLSELSAADIRLKLESLQVTRSFKVRGALNALMRVAAAPSPPVVVTASAGNHGRAIAWAAEQLRLSAVVFTPAAAPRAKIGPIARHGADLRAVAADYEDAEQMAMAYARDSGAVFISPYSHPDVIAGGGTVALEIQRDWPGVDAIVVAIGGGGLVSGIARLSKAASPGIRVVGVEVEASCAFTAARRAGRIVPIEVGHSLADGLGGNVEPDTLTWEYIRDLVDDVVTVSESELRAALRGLVGEEHLIAEGAGVAAIAAVASRRVSFQGRRVAVVVSGANIDVTTLTEAITT
jgi:threonine dehydratase